jgi:hypothetical protein
VLPPLLLLLLLMLLMLLLVLLTMQVTFSLALLIFTLLLQQLVLFVNFSAAVANVDIIAGANAGAVIRPVPVPPVMPAAAALGELNVWPIILLFLS